MEKLINWVKSLVHNRVVSWFLLIVMLGCFGFASWAFMQIKSLKDEKSREAMKSNKLAMANDSLAMDNERIAEDWGQLLVKAGKAQDSLINELQDCRDHKSTPIKADSPDIFIQQSYRIKTQLFEVAIYGCGEVEKGVQRAEKYLQKEFNVLEAVTFKVKPDWYADRNTIFYYSDQGKTKAAEIAAMMEKETEQQFVLARGAGSGVSKLKYDFSFRIHFVGKNCRPAPPIQQQQQQHN